MSLTLKPDENIIAECRLEEFQATLTNYRLIIQSMISEENFPLRGISGIGIYDDVRKYEADFKAAKEKSFQTSMGIGFMVGFILAIFLFLKDQTMFGFLTLLTAVVIGFIAANKNPFVPLDSILNIMQQGGSRQFRFSKTDQSAHDIKGFIDKVNDTLN